MTLTLYISKRFENTIMGLRIGTFLGVSVHLPCRVVYLCDNRIEICCKLSPLYLFHKQNKNYSHDCKASFVFYETIEAMLILCLTVYIRVSHMIVCKIYITHTRVLFICFSQAYHSENMIVTLWSGINLLLHKATQYKYLDLQ